MSASLRHVLAGASLVLAVAALVYSTAVAGQILLGFLACYVLVGVALAVELVGRDTPPSPSDRWWLPIFALAGSSALVPVFWVLTLLEGTAFVRLLAAPPIGVVLSTIGTVAFVVHVVGAATSPAAVYIDRRYVSRTTGWTPSKLYYLMFVPGLTSVFLSIAYIYNRHRVVGVP